MITDPDGSYDNFREGDVYRVIEGGALRVDLAHGEAINIYSPTGWVKVEDPS